MAQAAIAAHTKSVINSGTHGSANLTPVRRHRVDADRRRAGHADDPRSRVSTSLHRVAPSAHPHAASLLYAGLVRKKSALSMLWLSGMATATASLQWLLWGYSLTFSHTAGRYIGDLHHVGFRHVLGQPSVVDEAVPDLLFALYHGTVAAIT